MIYFQGTDNKLWRANPDGSGGVNLGGYKTRSTPIAFGDFVYFQGTDNTLWRINLDGSGGINLGGYKTSSSPCVTAGNVYFRGTDNKLWKINLDGSGGVHLGGYDTQSTPFVSGGYVVFQGTDNKLWRIHIDGTGGINLGLHHTKSSPYVAQGFVYFQGTDDKLWKVNLSGSQSVNLGGYKAHSTPYVTDQHVYFQGTDDKLWQINLDGSGGVNLGGYKARSSPTVDTSAGLVYFQGTDNALWRLDLDGSHGIHAGGFDCASTPFVVQPSNQPQTGSAVARYTVLTVVYAPPGTTGGSSQSSIDYGSSSLLGTTISVGSSFKAGLTIGATLGNPDKGPSAGAEFGLSNTSGDSASLDVKKTASLDISLSGPNVDGIHHDEDLIYLWLSPQLTITIDPQDNLSWQLGVAGPTMIVAYVRVGWLRTPSSMPAGVQRQLAAAGVTASDYATILAVDPFASGATAIDPVRFLPTPFSFPYSPPTRPGDPVPTFKYTQTNAVTYTATHTSETQYGVSLSGAAKVFDVALKATGMLQWTDTSSSGTTTASSQSATVVVAGPSLGYTGPTDVLVYWDTIYNSYMFAFVTDTPSASGIIHNRAGQPVPHAPVTLSVGSQVFHSFTDAKGEYRFHRTPAGQGQIAVLNERFVLGPSNLQAVHTLSTI